MTVMEANSSISNAIKMFASHAHHIGKGSTNRKVGANVRRCGFSFVFWSSESFWSQSAVCGNLISSTDLEIFYRTTKVTGNWLNYRHFCHPNESSTLKL
ncbi:hypothetical protein CDAR_233611 [Caerostris darwini]|uniref:Uncharacterized protein n=1 Tax=Caerostris darwini TaxID=1538125 RepID=A0AAV4Q410_9ARAC|nr:hypothetical protein CDAR_233611 [Caerostris darwini]